MDGRRQEEQAGRFSQVDEGLNRMIRCRFLLTQYGIRDSWSLGHLSTIVILCLRDSVKLCN